MYIIYEPATNTTLSFHIQTTQYATCLPLCQTETAFETASELVISSFNHSINEYNKHGHLAVSACSPPLKEASNAFKHLLCSSPGQFSTPAAKAALDKAWRMPYSCQYIAIEDRETLCNGLCAVILSLPSEQWNTSLDGLAQPILSCLTVITREADQITATEGTDIAPIMNRLSNEIRLLAAIVRFFILADTSKNFSGEEKEKVVACHRNAVVALLHKSWPSLTHIGNRYCSHEVSETKHIHYWMTLHLFTSHQLFMYHHTSRSLPNRLPSFYQTLLLCADPRETCHSSLRSLAWPKQHRKQ